MAPEPATIAERLAVAVLEWLDASGWIKPGVDLCLIASVPGIEISTWTQITISGGRHWSLARVDSDLSLRLALVRSSGLPLVAFSDRDEGAFQADLRERAVLRRVIAPLARHLLAAVVNREATALDDERFRQAVLDVLGRDPDRLEEASLRRTWSGGIRDQDAAAILCDAAFGFDDRQSATTAADLWAKWIVDPPATTAPLRDLAADVLQRRYPGQAAVLERILREGADVVFLGSASHDADDEAAVRQLSVETARLLLNSKPDVLAKVLEPAETRYVRAGSPDSDARLLEHAYFVRARALARRCGSSTPPGPAEVEHAREFVYATKPAVDALGVLSRVARGLNALEGRELPSSLEAYGVSWLQELAWLDRSVRRLRTTHVQDAEFISVADQLVSRWYVLRDRWNAAFADMLTKRFGALFAAPGERGPLVVSQLLKYVVLPGIERAKTFLVVLDGCDIPTFLELLDALVSVGVGPVERVQQALSAIPTMTGHARRAIFGGDIPHDGLSEEDDRAADASGDRKAFEAKSSILGELPRQLFLKGDLADGGAGLINALRSEGQIRLIAAVFNDIDDALSSKERTVLAERTLSNASRAFRDAMIAASDAGWRIVVTADHGNTPYREPDIVVPGFRGSRFVELAPEAAAPPAAAVFERGVGLPYRIAALHQLGAHGGPQHVGYHGGVGMEEMFVPLGFLGPVAPNAQVMESPGWWSGVVSEGHVTGPRLSAHTTVARIPARNGHAAFVAHCRAALEATGHDPKNVAILEGIAESGVLASAQLASRIAVPVGRIRLRVTGIITKLRSAGIEPPIVIEDEPEAFRWIGPT